MSTEAPVPALVLAATPIGDPADAAPRLTHELASAPLILAEDTRRTKRLCDALGVTPSGSMMSYHEHNEAQRTGEIVERTQADGSEMVSVFLPTTPNPTSGFFMIMRRDECIELEMTVDAALRYVVSMGVVAPTENRTRPLPMPMPIPGEPLPETAADQKSD